MRFWKNGISIFNPRERLEFLVYLMWTANIIGNWQIQVSILSNMVSKHVILGVSRMGQVSALVVSVVVVTFVCGGMLKVLVPHHLLKPPKLSIYNLEATPPIANWF